MPLARTTFRPDLVFNMEQAEFDALLSAHLLYVDWRTLYVNYLDYSDGPPATVTNVAVVIKDGGNNTVQSASGTDIQQIGAGAYLYRWSNASVPGSGTYHITWTALDADSVTCTATDTVTVTDGSAPAAPNTPTIGTATGGDASASVTFTPAASGSAATGYTVTSTPGSHTGTGTATPITVSGLTNGTGYTFTVHATNGVGSSAESAASNSVTPSNGITTLAADTFTRADQTGLGDAETGGTWTVSGGTSWNIVSDKAVGTVASGWHPNWLAVGATDVTVQLDFQFNGGLIDHGPIARVTDAGNLLWLDLNTSGADLIGNIFKRVAGSNTALGTLFTVTNIGNGMHTAKLVCSGTALTAYIDGAQVCTGTDSSQTGTNAGFASSGGQDNQNVVDNFSVTTP